MQVKKKIIIGSVMVIVFIVAWMLAMRKPINDVIIEEDIGDLPQKPMVALDTYMPIVKDAVWVYEDSAMPYEPISAWVDFVKNNIIQIRFKQGSKMTAKVFIAEEEAIYEVATVENATIKQDYTTLRQYNNIIMKLPVEVGNSWTLSNGAMRTITNVGKIYKTELGGQKSIEITTKYDSYTIIETYVEKTGLFSLDYTSSTGDSSITFSKLNNNKPQEEQVTLCLVNEETGKFEIVTEQVVVLTNEEPKHFLTDLLRKVPNKDYLVGISNDATISTLFLDEEEQTLYVEMSHEFINPQYTKGEREKVIMSVASTLGQYYNAEYVVITVEGQAYPLKSALVDDKGRIKVKY